MKNIVRIRSPFSPAFYNTRDEFITPFSQLFDELLNHSFPDIKEDFGIQFAKSAYPKVDVIDNADSVEIIAEIAGWKKDEINIEVENEILTISGETQNRSEIDEKSYLLRELKRSSFQRTFKLTEKLNVNTIIANFEDGILSLKIMKKENEEEKQKKKIQIK